MHRVHARLLIGILALLLPCCSFNKLAVKLVAKTLSSGDSTVFTGDDDPQLVADALYVHQ